MICFCPYKVWNDSKNIQERTRKCDVFNQLKFILIHTNTCYGLYEENPRSLLMMQMFVILHTQYESCGKLQTVLLLNGKKVVNVCFQKFHISWNINFLILSQAVQMYFRVEFRVWFVLKQKHSAEQCNSRMWSIHEWFPFMV